MGRYSRLAKWEGSFSYTRVDGVLKVAAAASVEIRRGGAPITIFSDEAGTVAIPNPFILPPTGWAAFFVAPDDAEFDAVVQAPSGEFATFTRANLRAFLQGRKLFAVDDYGTFAAAVAELVALGIGGEILLERDIVTAASLSIAGLTGIDITGISPEVTITAADGLNAIVLDASGTTHCRLRNFRIEGNADNQTVNSARVGLTMTGSTRCLVEDLEITDCLSDGITMGGSSVDLRIHRVKSFSNHGHGFVHGGSGGRATRLHLVGCTAEDNGDPALTAPAFPGYPRNVGFDFEPTPDGLIMDRCISRLNQWDGIGLGSESANYTAQDTRIINCHTNSNAQDPALFPGSGVAGLALYVQAAHPNAATDGVLISGCTMTDELEAGLLVSGGAGGNGLITGLVIENTRVYLCDRHGIRLNQSIRDAVVHGCHAYNNANDGGGFGIGISVQGQASPADCRRVSVTNCHSYDNRGGAATQVQGFVLATFTLDCRLSDNTAYGNVAGANPNYSYGNSVNTIFHNNHDL